MRDGSAMPRMRGIVAASVAAASLLASDGAASAPGDARSAAPVPSSAPSAPGAETDEQELARLEREQKAIVEKLRRDIDATPKTDDAYQRKMRLLADIRKRIDAQNSRPWRRYVGPGTREAVYANYYRAMERRIEEFGTRVFPTFRGRKIYGELTMNITVDSAGRVIETEVVRSSGNPLLDRKAVDIARVAGPYGAFGAELSAKADQVVMTYHFRFVRAGEASEAGAASTASGPQP